MLEELRFDCVDKSDTKLGLTGFEAADDQELKALS